MSSFNVTVVDAPEYLRVTTAGQYSLEGLLDLLVQAKAEAQKAGKTRVLIDSRPIQGNMTEAERFQGGEKIAELFGARFKVAAVMPPETITGLGQLTAANRGARFLVTSSEQAAIDWLIA